MECLYGFLRLSNWIFTLKLHTFYGLDNNQIPYKLFPFDLARIFLQTLCVYLFVCYCYFFYSLHFLVFVIFRLRHFDMLIIKLTFLFPHVVATYILFIHPLTVRLFNLVNAYFVMRIIINANCINISNDKYINGFSERMSFCSTIRNYGLWSIEHVSMFFNFIYVCITMNISKK